MYVKHQQQDLQGDFTRLNALKGDLFVGELTLYMHGD